MGSDDAAEGAIDVPGLDVRPQVPLFAPAEFLGRPDLVDEDLRIVLEADPFEWHGDRAALRHDARSILEAAVAERAQRACPRCAAV